MRIASRITGFLVNVLAFVGLAIGGGLGTAWYMVENGSRFSTYTFGPWTIWSAAGRPDADPYTRAHTLSNAMLPLSSTLEVTYTATADSANARLSSACEYAIVVESFDPAWWSLAAFDAKGGVIANAADRYAFNAETVMREPDGRAVITLARDARPGNWIPLGGAGRITLLLTVQDNRWAAAAQEGTTAKALPEIQRIACR
jgi:hypothetical protein